MVEVRYIYYFMGNGIEVIVYSYIVILCLWCGLLVYFCVVVDLFVFRIVCIKFYRFKLWVVFKLVGCVCMYCG